MSKKEKHPRILVVESDNDHRMLIHEAMAAYYGVSNAADIVEVSTAGECLKQDLNSFDIVLQDYHLPDMKGLDLLDSILSQADIPVIFVTGENSSNAAAMAIQHGAQDYVVRMGDYLFALPVLVEKSIGQHNIKKDNERLQDELQSMLSELRVKNVQLQETLEKVERMAATEPMTGLANRRRFRELLERYFSEAVRYGFDLTCCMCDLDYYKDFNDTFGHQIGDDILVATANIIRSSLRSSDMAARYGGDEFVLLLPHTSIARAQSVGERIRDQLALASDKYGQLEHMLTLSVGIASLNANKPHDSEELVAMADRALYFAKDHGRNQIITYSEVLRDAKTTLA